MKNKDLVKLRIQIVALIENEQEYIAERQEESYWVGRHRGELYAYESVLGILDNMK